MFSDYWQEKNKILADGFEANKHLIKPFAHQLWQGHRIALWYNRAPGKRLDALCTYLMLLPEADRDRWIEALREPYEGHNPDTYPISTKVGIRSNCNISLDTSGYRILDGHHVATIEATFARPITSWDCIVELGGGIGDLASFVCDLGFKGDYTILDSKEMGQYSTHYLRSYKNVKVVSDLAVIKYTPNTLIISTWSLDEFPLEYREQVCLALRGHWYIIATPEIQNINNLEWFKKYFCELTWTDVTIANALDGDIYVFGEPSTKEKCLDTSDVL